MFDLKKFLRIEISGYVCLLYTLLFTACVLTLLKPGFGLNQLDPEFWYKSPFAAIPVALILGFIIHQVSIMIFNPFCEYRTFFGKRIVLKALKERAEGDGLEINGIDKNGLFDALAGLPSKKNPGYSEHLHGEISRRYSFYYARMDAGVFAPILGLILALFIYSVLFLQTSTDSVPTLADGFWPHGVLLMVVALTLTLVIFLGMFIYCRKLIREIDILECALLAENYDAGFVKEILKEYEAGIRNNS